MSTAVATAALVPALLLSTGGSAAAANHSLTLTALNRSGVKVAVSGNAVHLASNRTYSLRAGKAKKLPKGKYAVLTSIMTGNTITLGAKTVKVSGASQVTVDARQGKQVRMSLSPAPAGLEAFTGAQICAEGNLGGRVEAEVSSSTALYVVPSRSKSLQFAALGSWSNPTAMTDAYAVLHRTTGVPSSPSRVFSQSRLATASVTARRGPSGAESAILWAQPDDDRCGSGLSGSLGTSERPSTTKVRFSPGKWEIGARSYATSMGNEYSYDGGWSTKLQAAAGKSYRVRFYNAAWGPSTQLPAVLYGRISFLLDDMFQDPLLPPGGEGNSRATATLKFRGKTVKTKKDNGNVYGPVLYYWVKKAGWYTLTNTATRYDPGITYPAGMLSTKSSVTYRFHAKPDSSVLARVYSIQMIPAGLDAYSRAAAGSVTNVTLKLSRKKQDPDAKRGADPKLKTLTASVSSDGVTWRPVPVKKINGSWTAVVKNPTSGAVSIKTRATYQGGGYTETTIHRAYGIS
ncbi:hypothetical protein AB0F81_00420 [Actinoplanes sp. NPDC024001]|uniref:hypothetical protein n=1 Tax=Actinoplanes sp. NPDC024001 TaxID=3154598 RepID=UPI0033C7A3DD